MNKDKKKDNGDWNKNNCKEPDRNNKEKKINYSLSSKKWKEILKGSIIISNS